MAMGERAGRFLWLAELVVLAAPSVAMLAAWSLMLIVGLLGFVGMAIPNMFKMDFLKFGELIALLLILIGLALAFAGMVALWRFVLLARGFKRYDKLTLADQIATFRSCVKWGLLPMMVMVPWGVNRIVLADDWINYVIGFYSSGLPLLIPIAHIRLELSNRRT
jgi:hypothetical protein